MSRISSALVWLFLVSLVGWSATSFAATPGVGRDCDDAFSYIRDTACRQYSFKDSIYTRSGHYQYVMPGAVEGGCDSIYDLVLAIGYPVEDTVEIRKCDMLIFNGNLYQADELLPAVHLTSIYGCDSIAHPYIRVPKSSPHTDIHRSACESFTIKGATYEESGNYNVLYTNIQGCDSAITVNLTINHATSGSCDSVVCDSLDMGERIFRRDTMNARVVITNHLGCDSVVSLNLFVKHSTEGDTVASACDSFIWYGHTFRTEEAHPKVVLANADGCDSVLTLSLTIRHSTCDTIDSAACDSLRWYGYFCRHSDCYFYRAPFLNQQKCDSSLVLRLALHRSSQGDTVAEDCDSIVWHGHVFSSNNDHPSYHTTNVYGCDSLVSLVLQLRRSTSSVNEAQACGSFVWNGVTRMLGGEIHDTMLNMAGCDSIITLNLTLNPLGEGALTGVFEVSEDRFVNFSQGNLQFLPSSNVWRFATRQYDYVGTGNNGLGVFTTSWIDLFGWGTSGYHNPVDDYNTNYAPISTDAKPVDFRYNTNGYGPSTNHEDRNLTGAASNYDWGVYCSIVNGGDAAGMWRTLSSEEWNYLINQRTQALNKRGLATISGISGMVILPEHWAMPSTCRFTSGNNNGFLTNVFTPQQWQDMEAAGAIFLPAAGVRYDSVASAINYNGYYWSTTYYDQEDAYLFLFEYDNIRIEPFSRCVGRSVRLVQDIDGQELPCVTYGDTVITAIDSVKWFGTIYNATGEYTRRLSHANVAGCDSIVVLHLTVKNGNEGIESPVMKKQLSLSSKHLSVIVDGAAGENVTLYDVTGRVLASRKAPYQSSLTMSVPAPGVYIVKVADSPAQKVFVTK